MFVARVAVSPCLHHVLGFDTTNLSFYILFYTFQSFYINLLIFRGVLEKHPPTPFFDIPPLTLRVLLYDRPT